MGPLRASRALVRPRAVSEASGQTLLLEHLLEPYLACAEVGAICVHGPSGSGKSSAMRHVASTLPRGALVAVFDDPAASDVAELADRMLVVYAAREPLPLPHRTTCRLADWGTDEILEYVLAAHRDRAASVMARAEAAARRGERPDCPEIWVACLDEMARDERLTDFRDAIQKRLRSRLSRTLRRRAGRVSLDEITDASWTWDEEIRLWGNGGCLGLLLGRGLSTEDLRFVRHPQVRALLAAQELIFRIREDKEIQALELRLSRDFVAGCGAVIRGDPSAAHRLETIASATSSAQAMAASILHAAKLGGAPQGPASLEGAYLAGANWADVRLPGARLSEADLSNAVLDKAVLDGALMRRTRLIGATLRGASLRHACADADFTRADLQGVMGEGAVFVGGLFRSARLDKAHLRGASFRGAILRDACLRAADLQGANFRQACLEGADLSFADLERADLEGTKLAGASCSGAYFARADMRDADLEGLDVTRCRFDLADLCGALLTGAAVAGASFRHARLCRAGLAEIDAEGADFRGADLRGASFHLGSSRSGLLFNAPPSEGSRTGFYTDEYYDQQYRAPEEIRKANLRGADLRGALLRGVDFYLVDLRGAKFTKDQADYFRRCGAILGC